MKIYFLILFILTNVSTYSQIKGVTPSPRSGDLSVNKAGGRGEVYAVVVGISDYQDPGIPDLRFADKDAEAFANYLRSKAGGELDNDHLKILINSQATMAQFAIHLDWLLENATENDMVFIYFSGHGDVEKKTLTQPGFLLCWDAPAQVYMSGGAFALPMLQEVISTLSIQNKAKVIVITDACRSGKLSGSSIQGNQLTNANLAKQYANEIKVLSCQPNEYSVEGEQWGGGRGAFSYHLIDALYGMADKNQDLSISMMELGRFLEDHVTTSVSPLSQVPMVVGDKMERISKVYPELLAQVKESKKNQALVFEPKKIDGIEEIIIERADSSIREAFRLFEESLKLKNFFVPKNASAEFYYDILIQEPSISKLHSTIKRNYAAALQDDAQQVMNRWYKSDPEELGLSKKSKKDKYSAYPHYLERAAELLGVNHYMYHDLQARRFLFEGYLLAVENQTPNPEAGMRALEKFKTALIWKPDLPQAYWQISLVFGYHLLQVDSLEYYTNKAIEMVPTWVAPYDWISYFLTTRFGLYDKAKFYLDNGAKLDSNNLGILSNMAIYYEGIGDFNNAERHYKKLVAIDSVHAPFNNLGALYANFGHYNEAEIQFRKAIRLDPTNDWSYRNLGFLLNLKGNYHEAESMLLREIELDSFYEESYILLAQVYEKTNRLQEGIGLYKKVIRLLPKFNDVWQMYSLGRAWLGLQNKSEMQGIINEGIGKWSQDPLVYYFAGCLNALAHNDKIAIEWLEKALQKNFKYLNQLNNDPDLTTIRQKPEFKLLIDKYFPKD